MTEADPVVEHVTSSDGTRIGYERSGAGPPLVLVHGTASAHWGFRFLAPSLVDRFTLYAVDRRGRGASEDRADYAIEREFEDVAAVVDSIDEPVSVFGHSYGATVALGAAFVARNLHRLILYEPAPGIPATAVDVQGIEGLVARGEPEAALVLMLSSVGMTPEDLDRLKASPTWAERVAAAHTVAREIRAEEAFDLDPERSGAITVPVLFLLGEESPDWAHAGTERLRAILPGARVAELPGEGHLAIMTAPELVALEVVRFLSG